jgi:hypothetical protein
MILEFCARLDHARTTLLIPEVREKNGMNYHIYG